MHDIQRHDEDSASGVHDLPEWDRADTRALLGQLLDGDAPVTWRRAEQLLAEAGSLRALAARASRVEGLRPRERRRLLAACEIGRRLLLERRSGDVLDTPRAVVARYRDLALSEVEVLVAVGVDSGRRAVVEHRMVGAVDGVSARPRDLLRPVLAAGATGLVVVHNHPSGHPEASASDLAFTQRLRAAAQLCGVTLVDHVIVASGGWTSLRMAGRLGDDPRPGLPREAEGIA